MLFRSNIIREKKVNNIRAYLLFFLLNKINKLKKVERRFTFKMWSTKILFTQECEYYRILKTKIKIIIRLDELNDIEYKQKKFF